jgi:hypothetical protein
MPLTKDEMRKQIKLLAIFIIASVIQAFFICSRCNDLYSYSRVIGLSFFMWVFLWQGNDRLTKYISSKISWIHQPVKRFFVGLITTVGYSLAAITFLVFVFKNYLGFNFGSSLEFTIWISVGCSVLISLFLHSREFLLHWRKAALEVEKFARMRATARYESLKSKVNPQLMQNSLALLKDLVPKDKDLAVKYIKHLSDVYRYALETRDREVVESKDELKFLNSFFFLIRTRFGDSVKLRITLDHHPFSIIPLAIKLLVEHVLDHRKEGSASTSVCIETIDDSLRLSIDGYAFRYEAAKDELKALLENIEHQYRVLTERPVTYSITENSVTCHLPLLRDILNQSFIHAPKALV